MVGLRIPSARSRDTEAPSARIAVVKRRDRVRLFAGLAVMAVCALLFGALAVVTGHRTRVLVLARPVAAGQVLGAGDVRSALVSVETGTAVVPAEERDLVVGQRVSASLPAGLLLSRELVGQRAVPAGRAAVALAVRDGRYPPVLGAGDQVAVYEAKPAGATAGTPGRVLGPVQGRVSEVRPSGGSSGGAVVVLEVAAADAGELVAEQEPSVVLLGGGR